MKILAEKLRDIRDQTLSLPSLAPGEGYDSLGFALCDIVGQTKMNYVERQAFFSYLDTDYPGLIEDLQDISIRSEIELDRHHARKILGRLKDPAVREKILSLSVDDRLPEILHEYPHGWIYARTHEVIRLLESLPVKAPLSGNFYIIGRSNLPLDALGFHLTTGCAVTWLDPYEDSTKIAADFIQELEEFGLIKSGAIKIDALNQDKPDLFSKDGLAVMILDDDMMDDRIFQQAFGKSLPIITVEPIGMAELLYPYSPELRPGKHLYEYKGAALAQHALDEPVNGEMYECDSTDMFLSLKLYKPVAISSGRD